MKRGKYTGNHHQIAPSSYSDANDARITLQGHAMQINGTWEVYWMLKNAEKNWVISEEAISWMTDSTIKNIYQTGGFSGGMRQKIARAIASGN